MICGQQTSYYDLCPSGKVGMIFVVFKPHGTKMFFNIPMNEIKDKNLPFEDIVNKEALVIEERIQNSKCIKDRIIIINSNIYIMKPFNNKIQNRQF